MRLALVTGILALALVACSGSTPGGASGSSGSSLSSAGSSAAGSAGPASIAPASSAPAGDGLRLVPGPLEPGVYATTAFQPPLRFALGSGWMAYFTDDDDELAVEHGESQTFLAMTRVSQVVDPASGLAVDAPDDLVQWFAAHPRFTADAPRPVEVAGIQGTAILVRSRGEEVAFFAYPTGNMRTPPGNVTRVIVLPMDGPDLAIVVGAPEDTFEQALELTDPILASLELRSPAG